MINLYEMFHTRSMLHRRAYQHKTTNIIEQMYVLLMVYNHPLFSLILFFRIMEALVVANDHLLIPGKEGMYVYNIDVLSVTYSLATTLTQ